MGSHRMMEGLIQKALLTLFALCAAGGAGLIWGHVGMGVVLLTVFGLLSLVTLIRDF